MIKGLAELDAHGTVAGAVSCVRARKVADCHLLEYAAHWAALNPGDGLCPPQMRLEIAGERAMLFGGAGTPDVAESAPASLGAEIGLNASQAVSLISDAQDLKYRFPQIWALVRRAWVDAWKARMVARQTRHLTKKQCAEIDARIARHINKASRGRLENLLDAQILRVDAENVRKNTERLLNSRAFRVGRATDGGLKDVYITMDAPDAIWLQATVSRLADILMDLQAHHRLPAGVRARSAQTKAEWEAVAVGVLAKPILAARIFIEDQQLDLFSDFAAGYAGSEQQSPAAGSEDDRESEDDHHEAAADHDPAVDQPAEYAPNPAHPEPTAHLVPSEQARQRALAAFVKAVDPQRFLPNSVLHVHVSDFAIINADESANGDAPDATVARVETLGPALLDVVRDWLGEGVNIKLQPHLNPATIRPLDSMRFPTGCATHCSPDRRHRSSRIRTAPTAAWISITRVPIGLPRKGRLVRPACTASVRSTGGSTE